jgi:hypothetical protein
MKALVPRQLAALGAVAALTLATASCDVLTGSSEGACVSDVVEFSQIGDRVYCYDSWDKSDCDANDADNVNGASWTFYEGQTCEDRGLTEGSNPWP